MSIDDALAEMAILVKKGDFAEVGHQCYRTHSESLKPHV